MILVTVGQNDGADMLLVFDEVSNVGNDDVNAKQLTFRKHEAGVDHDNVVFPAKREAIHAEFAEAAEGDDFKLFSLHLSVDANTRMGVWMRRCWGKGIQEYAEIF